MEKLYSNFDRLRLPLIIMVVFIHAQFSVKYISAIEIAPYNFVSYFFTTVISAVAVPLFFFISGCLYFRDYSDFSKELYIEKQKRRINTLVIPYFVWNAFFWLLFTAFMLLVPSLINGGIPSIIGASFKDFVFVFWGTTDGGPIDFPLWFIRDLILVSFISPLLYYLLFRFKYGFMIVLFFGAMWFVNIPIVVFGNDIKGTLFFFSLGAYLNKVPKELDNKMMLSMYRINRMKVWGGHLLLVIWLLVCCFACINHFCWNESTLTMVFRKLGVIVGIPAIYYLVENKHLFFDKIRTYIPSDCVFFIFASHGFLITVIKRVVEKMSLNHEYVYIACYFGNVMLTILICICLYLIIKKYAPQLFVFLTGRIINKIY